MTDTQNQTDQQTARLNNAFSTIFNRTPDNYERYLFAYQSTFLQLVLLHTIVIIILVNHDNLPQLYKQNTD